METEYLFRRTALVFFASVTLLLLPGCGEGERTYEAEKTFPVVGKVLVDGKTVEMPQILIVKLIPAEGAQQAADGSWISTASARVGADGSFKVSKYEAGDGVPAGKYKLTFRLGKINIMAGGQVTGDLFDGKYEDPADSEVTVEVTGSETEPIDLGTIELSTD